MDRHREDSKPQFRVASDSCTAATTGPICLPCRYDILHEEKTRKDRRRTVEAPEHDKAHPLVERTRLEGVSVRPHMPAPAPDGFLFGLSNERCADSTSPQFFRN